MSYVIENNIIKTEPIDFDFAALGGLGNILFKSMKKNGQNIAQIDPESGKQNTYEDILKKAIRTAIVMRRKGIGKGDIVMGCSDNHLNAHVPILAALFLGAIPCSMDPSVTHLEMTHIIKQVKPKMIFTIPLSLEGVREICRQLNLNSEIVVFGATDEDTDFQSFIEKQTGEEQFESVVSQDPKETAIVFFSSGTTGLAKACCLSHAYFIGQSTLIPNQVSPEDLDLERMKYEGYRFTQGGVFLNYSPPSWISGGKIFFENTFFGTTILYGRRFDPEYFWYMVEKYGIFCTLLSPFQISQLAKYGKPNVNTHTLVKIITGGARSQKRYWKLLQDILPEVDIVQNYGLTETNIITGFQTFNKPHREYYRVNTDCVGFPVTGVWYKVINTDTGEVLGPNQEGELLVKSEFFANGYYDCPSDSIFDEDGWFRTGDVAYYTENCAFFITDRLKELLKYRQMTVYPYVIENRLMEHPAVAQAVVVGVPHEEDGDRPAALVVLNENFESLTADKLREFVDEKMQDKAKLRGGLRIVESIPITPLGKVKRRELRKMIQEK